MLLWTAPWAHASPLGIRHGLNQSPNAVKANWALALGIIGFNIRDLPSLAWPINAPLLFAGGAHKRLNVTIF
jgi:hypothetical protein